MDAQGKATAFLWRTAGRNRRCRRQPANSSNCFVLVLRQINCLGHCQIASGRLALSASYGRAEAGFLLQFRVIVEADCPKRFGSNLGPKPRSGGPKNEVSEQQGQQIQRDFGGSVWESNPPSWPRRTGSMALKATRITGSLSPPRTIIGMAMCAFNFSQEWSAPSCGQVREVWDGCRLRNKCGCLALRFCRLATVAARSLCG